MYSKIILLLGEHPELVAPGGLHQGHRCVERGVRLLRVQRPPGVRPGQLCLQVQKNAKKWAKHVCSAPSWSMLWSTMPPGTKNIQKSGQNMFVQRPPGVQYALVNRQLCLQVQKNLQKSGQNMFVQRPPGVHSGQLCLQVQKNMQKREQNIFILVLF